MSSSPVWLETKTLKEAISIILDSKAPNEAKENALKALSESVKALPSIKDCKINEKTGKFEIIEYKGLTRTSVGGDIGTENAARFQTGWANLFKKGETVSLIGRLTQNKAPSVSIAFTIPDLKNIDFLRKNPYQKYEFSLNIGREPVHGYPVDTIALKGVISAGKKPFQQTFSISSIKQITDNTAPFPLRYEPSPYFKLSYQILMPGLQAISQNQVTIGVLTDADKEIDPFIKANLTKGVNLPYGVNIFASGGFMSKLRPKKGYSYSLTGMRPMPFPEKFFIGGVPSARGIEERKFGYAYGGFPQGLDAFATATIEEKLILFPQYQLNGHLFVSGTIGRNFSSYFPCSADPDWTSSVVAGAGLTFVQGPAQIELNIQTKLYQTGANNKVLTYQFGITPIQ